jgi:hypothetical protein
MRISSTLLLVLFCRTCLTIASDRHVLQNPLQYPLDPFPASETITLDPSWFSDDSTDSTTILIDGSDVQAILSDPSKPESTDLTDFMTQALQNSLPFLLQGFGIDDSDVAEIVSDVIPLMVSSMIEAFGGTQDNSLRHGHDLSGDIADWGKQPRNLRVSSNLPHLRANARCVRLRWKIVERHLYC